MCTEPSRPKTSTLSVVIVAISFSSRKMKLRVTGNRAKISEATKFSPIPSPITKGEPQRAAYKTPSSFLSIRAIAYEPLTSFKAFNKASLRLLLFF